MTATAALSWLDHFGFRRTPFSKSLAASELFPRQPHLEAVARIHAAAQGALQPT